MAVSDAQSADTGCLSDEVPEADATEDVYEIPEGDYYEVVVLTCPVAGCDWEMPYSWGDMENRRPDEYVAHYRAEHNDGKVAPS